MRNAGEEIVEVTEASVPQEVPSESGGQDDPLTILLNQLQLRCVARSQHQLARGEVLSFDFEAATFHLVLEGSCRIQRAESPSVSLQQGDYVILLEGTPHELACEEQQPLFLGSAQEGAKVLSGVVKTIALQDALVLAGLPKLLHLPTGELRQSHLSTVLTLIQPELCGDRPGSTAMVNMILTLVTIQSIRGQFVNLPEESSSWLKGLADREIGPILARMVRNPEENWSLQQLAELGHLSRSTFARRFREVTGRAPMDVLTTIRMNLACELLRSDLGQKEIARRVGYTSMSAFSVAFHRRLGMSPLQYRVEHELNRVSDATEI